MKSVLVLSLTSSALAVPFRDSLDGIFGKHEASQLYPSPLSPNPPDGRPYPVDTSVIPTGTGLPFPPMSTGTGPAIPEGTGIYSILPVGPMPTLGAPPVKRLQIDYKIAAHKHRPRQELPEFSVVEPGESTVPTGTGLPSMPAMGPPTPVMPTGQVPYPTGTGGVELPTTLETLTRGPQPTNPPEMPEFTDEPGSEGWFETWQQWQDAWSQWANDNNGKAKRWE